MITLNISASRSGKDKIKTDGKSNNLNKRIFVDDVKNIIKENMQYYGGVDYDEMMLAIKEIVVYLATTGIYELSVDINKLEYTATPKRKMTKTEIEKALGYPIDIVEENK